MQVEQGVRAVVSAVREELSELVVLVQARLHEEVPEFYVAGDPTLSGAELETVPASLEAIFRGLADQLEVEDTVPGVMLRQARLAAQVNASLHALIRKQRVAQAAMWDAFFDAAQRVVSDDELRAAVLRRISQYHFAWNDHIVAVLISEYEAEHRLYFLQRTDRKKRAMVNAVLAGTPPDEQSLGYPMSGRHLAVIAWGEQPEAAIKHIASRLGAKYLLVSGTDDAYFGWIRRAARSTRSDDDLTSVELPPNTRVACGHYANDVAGFRASHARASLAYRVAKLGNRRLTWYRDVSLEALVLRDLPAAGEFVRQELGSLLDGSVRSRTLLETIKTYYALGQNAAATGARLKVNERTVAYRLRSVEGMLGNTVWERREEIAVAIRIAELLEHTRAAHHGLGHPPSDNSQRI
ncbi:PucR family transcriptional regulator [Terrabacter sp. C0L_2]|uniref:PucR family transcriptional regulator n=1 Tax=Terrabacter sp. C0L_2 TaxID=3108389 RepID=UPI002ECFE5B4|nr:helix-turn-helix domain-containing protein [Terrabacter sp. C0L_2]